MPRQLVVVTLALVVCLGACHKGGGSPTDPTQDGATSHTVSTSGKITDFVLSGQFAGAFGTQVFSQTTSAPAAGAGPTITVTGTTTVSTADAVASYAISASTAFQKVFVSAPGKTGSLELDMPTAKTDQGITIFFAGLAGSFTLQVQAVSAAGAAGPIATLPITSVTGGVGSLVAFASPDPIPYNGKTCALATPVDLTQGCPYEAMVTVFNQGGASVNVTEYDITWTYGNAAAGSRTFTFPTLAGQAQLAPANGTIPFPVFVRCSQPTCDGSFFAPTPGKMFIKVLGTDSSGRAVNFQSQNFILSTP